jgi:hypothetical protein
MVKISKQRACTIYHWRRSEEPLLAMAVRFSSKRIFAVVAILSIVFFYVNLPLFYRGIDIDGDRQSSTKRPAVAGLPPNGEKGRQEPKAIVVGLPKSGTTSIYHLFHCSGFKTSHFCCCGSAQIEYPCGNPAQRFMMSAHIQSNLLHGQPLLANLGDYEIHTQLDGETNDGGYFLPQHYDLEQLDKASESAIWILNLRPSNEWARSVLQWLDLGRRLENDYYERFGTSLVGAIAKQPTTFAFLVEFYNNHTRQIRDYAQSHPSRTVIEVDITSNQTVTGLSKYFQVRSDCWSRSNEGPFFQVG